MSKENIIKIIDHTMLKPNARQADIEKLCQEAKEYGFYSVAVNSCWTALCAQELEGSDVKVTTCIGFPLGTATTFAKIAETTSAVVDGTDEIDMVLNVGKFLDGDKDYVVSDIAGVVTAARGLPVKVILECCLLTTEQIVEACRLCVEAGASFVKTSTGFSSGGATVEDVKAMAETVHPAGLLVKAAGGIHNLEAAEAMVAAGADRLGASSGVKIAQS